MIRMTTVKTVDVPDVIEGKSSRNSPYLTFQGSNPWINDLIFILFKNCEFII